VADKPLKEDLDFLTHHGVKGMKWGVRHRRRNEKARAERFNPKSRAKNLSDADLKTAIQRMELEKRYVDLSTHTSTKSGTKYAKSLLETSGKTVVGAVVGAVATKTVKKVIKT
jgi:hypothetical protein